MYIIDILLHDFLSSFSLLELSSEYSRMVALFTGLNLLVPFLCGTVWAQPAPGDSAWLMFHHDNYHTGLSPLTGDMDTCELGWSFTTGSDIRSSPVLGDIDGDGKLEVVVGSNDNKMYALNGEDGSLLWLYITGGDVRSSPALGDINGDGRFEVVIGSDDYNIYALNGEDGSLLWSLTILGWVQSPALGDVDEDGKLEVVVGCYDRLYALDGHDGGLLWSHRTWGDVCSSPALGDIDADGKLEVVYVAYMLRNGIYALDAEDGGLLWSYRITGLVRSSPALGDIDGDGKFEVIIGSDNYNIYAFNGEDGSLLWLYTAGNQIVSSPALGDIDGDGKIEVVVGCLDGKVYAINGVPTRVEEGKLISPNAFLVAQSRLYPFTQIVEIKYGITKDSYVNIDVYNLLGQKVTTIVNNHQKAGKYIVKWDAENLGSGIYLIRFKTYKFKKTKKIILIK